MDIFSWRRFLAILKKEFIQMIRDRVTFSMIVVLPLMQLLLFGYALNTDPKNLPLVVNLHDHSPLTRSILKSLETSEYFKIIRTIQSDEVGEQMLASQETQFVLSIPANFTRDVIRQRQPKILLEADATDPVATANALSAIGQLTIQSLARDLQGSLSFLLPKDPPYRFDVHRKYNPEGITQYNIVPGLMGTVLTLTLVILAAAGVTREKERGTMEYLLSTPVRPIEVMLGKIIPFMIIGFIQIAIIIGAGKVLFDVPIVGSIALLCLISLLFIIANLSVGFTFSTLSKTQMQANQMGTFFFLPSILLSGFFFPFLGMPIWAQYIGTLLPMTHYLRIVRGILLKGNGILEIWGDVWPLIAFMVAAIGIALWRYKETLD
jgi:ABC-2 type transport system permease protein